MGKKAFRKQTRRARFGRARILRTNEPAARKPARRLLHNLTILLVAVICLLFCGGVYAAETEWDARSAGARPRSLLTAAPGWLDFGDQTVGSPSSAQTLLVTNRGALPIVIHSIRLEGSGFAFSAPSPPVILTARESMQIRLVFIPGSPGFVQGNLSITSTASDVPLQVPLQGSGVRAPLSLSHAPLFLSEISIGPGTPSETSVTPTSTAEPRIKRIFTIATDKSKGRRPPKRKKPGSSIALSPESLDFGSVPVGTTSTRQQVTVTNTGSTTVTISSISLTAPEFALPSPPVLPLDLAASQSFHLDVIFTPSASGPFTGQLQVFSTAPNSPHHVALSGAGVAPSFSVALAWDPSTSVVVGYNVYRSMTSGGSYTQLNTVLIPSAAFTDGTVEAGQTYYYMVTAVDFTEVESPPSNEVTAAIPAS